MIHLTLETCDHVCTLLYDPLAPHHNILHHMCIPYIYYFVMHT